MLLIIIGYFYGVKDVIIVSVSIAAQKFMNKGKE